MMASLLKTKSLGNNKAVAYFSGRIDVSIAHSIEEELNNLVVSESISSMIINLEAVEYLSSSGFRVLIALMRKLQSTGGSLKLCALKPEIKSMFDVIEMTSLFDIFDTEDQAIN